MYKKPKNFNDQELARPLDTLLKSKFFRTQVYMLSKSAYDIYDNIVFSRC